MGDRPHLRRQGDMRELEERDEIFPRSPAYGAVPNDGSSLLIKSGAFSVKERGSNGAFTLSTMNFSGKRFHAAIGGSGEAMPE